MFTCTSWRVYSEYLPQQWNLNLTTKTSFCPTKKYHSNKKPIAKSKSFTKINQDTAQTAPPRRQFVKPVMPKLRSFPLPKPGRNHVVLAKNNAFGQNIDDFLQKSYCKCWTYLESWTLWNELCGKMPYIPFLNICWKTQEMSPWKWLGLDCWTFQRSNEDYPTGTTHLQWRWNLKASWKKTICLEF